MRYLLAALITLCPALTAAQEEVPCVVKKGEKWVIDKDTTCIQHSVETQTKYNAALLKLKFYQTEYEPACELTKTRFKALDDLWKQSLANWEQQKALQEKMMGEKDKIAETWRSAFFQLKNEKAPPESWTRSPLLWVGVGVLVAGGAIGLGFYLHSTLAK